MKTKSLSFISLFIFLISYNSTCQITLKELKSDSMLIFIQDMLMNESEVYGKLELKNGLYNVSADSEKGVSSFMFSNSIFKTHSEQLVTILNQSLNFINTNNRPCFEYLIIHEEKWELYLFDCLGNN